MRVREREKPADVSSGGSGSSQSADGSVEKHHRGNSALKTDWTEEMERDMLYQYSVI